MKNELNKIIKTFEGFVLCIGVSDEITNLIDKNENILNYDILTNTSSKKGNTKHSFFSKTIDINKIRKKYKKKKIDYIICNYDVIKPYIRKFIRNSVYINKNKLYFYGDIDRQVLNRYKRYDTIIKEYKNIIEIDNTKSKSNFIKEIFYSIVDITSSLIEIIGDVLMG